MTGPDIDTKRFPRERLLKDPLPEIAGQEHPVSTHDPVIARKRSSGMPTSWASSATTASNALLPRRRCGLVSRAENIPPGGDVTAQPLAVRVLEWGVQPCRR
jgi:hypothetical protein